MTNPADMLSWSGHTMVDSSGSKIGTIEEVFVDDETGQPEFALVRTGLFGHRSTFVPLAQAELRDGDVMVPYEKAKVRDAPRTDRDDSLSPQEEAELYRYFGLDYVAGATEAHGTGQGRLRQHG